MTSRADSPRATFAERNARRIRLRFKNHARLLQLSHCLGATVSGAERHALATSNNLVAQPRRDAMAHRHRFE